MTHCAQADPCPGRCPCGEDVRDRPVEAAQPHENAAQSAASVLPAPTPTRSPIGRQIEREARP